MNLSLNDNLKTISLKAGEVLFRKDDEAKNFYIISSGSTCSFLVKESRAIPLRLSIKNDLVGEEACVIDLTRYNYNTVAMEETELIVLENVDVKTYLDGSQSWLRDILSAISKKIENTEQTLFEHQIVDAGAFDDGFSVETENMLLKNL